MKAAVLTSLAALVASTVGMPGLQSDRELHALPTTHLTSASSTVHMYDQLIDHAVPAGPGNTYQQRWWQNTEHLPASGDGPIILEVCGEGPCHESRGWSIRLAEAMQGVVVALEHRYYGESWPYGDAATSLSNARIGQLTVDAALADVNRFISWYRASNATLANVPLVIVGGSYPGALVAWFSVAYPGVANAVLSSSGVVHAKEIFPEFDTHVAKAVGPACAADVHVTMLAFEMELQGGPARAAAVRAQLNVSANMTDGDVGYMLADAAAMLVQYGRKDALCTGLAGAASTALPSTALTQRFSWLITEQWGKQFSTDCFYDTACLADPARASEWHPTARAWRWQKCSEVGWFQVRPSGTGYPPLRISAVNETYVRQQCADIFGGVAPAAPAVAALNAKFGGLDIASKGARNVIFSQGSDDPWAEVGMNVSVSTSLVTRTAVCDGCGHCLDLHMPATSDSDATTAQRVLEVALISGWIQA